MKKLFPPGAQSPSAGALARIVPPWDPGRTHAAIVKSPEPKSNASESSISILLCLLAVHAMPRLPWTIRWDPWARPLNCSPTVLTIVASEAPPVSSSNVQSAARPVLSWPARIRAEGNFRSSRRRVAIVSFNDAEAKVNPRSVIDKTSARPVSSKQTWRTIGRSCGERLSVRANARSPFSPSIPGNSRTSVSPTV